MRTEDVVIFLWWSGISSLVATLAMLLFAHIWRDRGLEIGAAVMAGLATIALSTAWMVSR